MKRKGKRLACLLLTLLLAFVSVLPVFAAEDPQDEIAALIANLYGDGYTLGDMTPCLDQTRIVWPEIPLEQIMDEKRSAAVLLHDGQPDEMLWLEQRNNGSWILGNTKELGLALTEAIDRFGDIVCFAPFQEELFLDVDTEMVYSLERSDGWDGSYAMSFDEFRLCYSYEQIIGFRGPTIPANHKYAAMRYWYGNSIDGGAHNADLTAEQTAKKQAEKNLDGAVTVTEVCRLYGSQNRAEVQKRLYDLAVLQGISTADGKNLTLAADSNPGAVYRAVSGQNEILLLMKQDDQGDWYCLHTVTDPSQFDEMWKQYVRRIGDPKPAVFYHDGDLLYLFDETDANGYLMVKERMYHTPEVMAAWYGAYFEIAEYSSVFSDRDLLFGTVGIQPSSPSKLYRWLGNTVLVILGLGAVVCAVYWIVRKQKPIWKAERWIIRLPVGFRFRNLR